MPKKVTNEKLARMIKNGFDEVNDKIGGARNELKKDIKRVEKNLSKTEKNLSTDIGRVEKKLDAEVERHDEHDLKIKDHEDRIVIVEKKLERV